MSKYSISEQQDRAIQQAARQADDYRVSLTNLKVREHSGRSYEVPVGQVVKSDGTTYQVTIRPHGVAACSCPISIRNRGKEYECKHAVLVRCEMEKRQADQDALNEQEHLEILTSAFALTEAEMDEWQAEQEWWAATERDRRLWDSN